MQVLVKPGRQVLEPPTALEQCLVDADGEVEVAECMVQHEAAHMLLHDVTTSALEQCLVDADGEVEVEDCISRHDDVDESELTMTDLEECLLNADGEVEAEACVMAHASEHWQEDELELIDVTEAVSQCLVAADGEVEMAECMEKHEAYDEFLP